MYPMEQIYYNNLGSLIDQYHIRHQFILRHQVSTSFIETPIYSQYPNVVSYSMVYVMIYGIVCIMVSAGILYGIVCSGVCWYTVWYSMFWCMLVYCMV